MRLRVWFVTFFLARLTHAADAFLVIPFRYHGKWVVPGKTHGTFTVTPEHVSARFRSAELKLKPKSIHTEENEIFLDDMEVVSHPSALDVRSVWRNIGYFYAVRAHGVRLYNLSVDDNVLLVHWFVNNKYSGQVSLTRLLP